MKKNDSHKDFIAILVILGIVFLILIAFVIDMVFDMGIKNSFVTAGIIGYLLVSIASFIV